MDSATATLRAPARRRRLRDPPAGSRQSLFILAELQVDRRRSAAPPPIGPRADPRSSRSVRAVFQQLSRRTIRALASAGRKPRRGSSGSPSPPRPCAPRARRAVPATSSPTSPPVERRGRDARHRHSQPMAAHELPNAIAQRVSAGRHGQALEMAADVGGQRLRRRVAPLRLLLERLRARSRRGRRASWRERARPRARPLRTGRLRAPAPPLEAQRAASRGVRPRAGEQLVEHDAQRIDVGGGGHGLAEHLLGRRVLGRQRAKQVRVAGGRLAAGRRPAAWRCRSRAASPARRRRPGCSRA